MTDVNRFAARGVVLAIHDLETLDWPERAARAGLNVIATHGTPAEAAAFIGSNQGVAFLEACRRHGLHVEHEFHAFGDLLPRSLFETDPSLFRMDDAGNRVPDGNLCIHSRDAVEITARNAMELIRRLPSTTGRYFLWPDDGKPMCRCERCRDLSDSEQALLLENVLCDAARLVDPRATMAHLAYEMTLSPPVQVAPASGVFLEFAPIRRRNDAPLSEASIPVHVELLEALRGNLRVFDTEDAQVLEYWLDVSRFAGWNRDRRRAIPWDARVFEEDLRAYAECGIRHITSFAAWLDEDYVSRFGEPPLHDYGQGLLRMAQPE